jgi:hypothetical protein
MHPLSRTIAEGELFRTATKELFQRSWGFSAETIAVMRTMRHFEVISSTKKLQNWRGRL